MRVKTIFDIAKLRCRLNLVCKILCLVLGYLFYLVESCIYLCILIVGLVHFARAVARLTSALKNLLPSRKKPNVKKSVLLTTSGSERGLTAWSLRLVRPGRSSRQFLRNCLFLPRVYFAARLFLTEAPLPVRCYYYWSVLGQWEQAISCLNSRKRGFYCIRPPNC